MRVSDRSVFDGLTEDEENDVEVFSIGVVHNEEECCLCYAIHPKTNKLQMWLEDYEMDEIDSTGFDFSSYKNNLSKAMI